MTARDYKDMGVNTRLAHQGYEPSDYHGFVNPPVVHASTVLFPDAATMAGRSQKYTYGTVGTPTTDALAAAIDALEGSDDVQNVYTNLDITPEVRAELENDEE